jgi:hypothetical protein
MSKRPLGLKREPNKRKKQEEELTIQLEASNDYEELDQLYEQAVEQLSIDSQQACLLFRGVVHECDKILRIVNDQVESTEQFQLMKKEWNPPRFYKIYGNGLYYLSLLDREEQKGFLELGLQMIEKSLAIEDVEETRHSHARILIQLAMIDRKPELLKSFKEQMEKEFNNFDWYLELCHHSHQFAETIEDFDEKKEWVLMNQQYWERVLEKEQNPIALIGLGNGYLYLADEMIQLMEDGKDVHAMKIQKYLEHALLHFESALRITMEKEENPTALYLLMGEVQVHLGNLLDKEDEESSESIDYYKQAVTSFRNVQKLDKDALPEQFEDFLIEWQQDFE